MMLMNIWRFFSKIFNNFLEFCSKMWAKIYNHASVGGSGGGRSPEASDFIKKISPKINGNHVFIQNFHKL